jgi:hypothetical protein
MGVKRKEDYRAPANLFTAVAIAECQEGDVNSINHLQQLRNNKTLVHANIVTCARESKKTRERNGRHTGLLADNLAQTRHRTETQFADHFCFLPEGSA